MIIPMSMSKHMKKFMTVAALFAFTLPVAAEQVDMTNLVCRHMTLIGQRLTWEFYDDVAIRYFEDGSVSSLPRVGTGSYERYGRSGEWAAIYLFHDVGEGVHLRTLSRPGLLAREQNRAAPLELNTNPFVAECSPLWEVR